MSASPPMEVKPNHFHQVLRRLPGEHALQTLGLDQALLFACPVSASMGMSSLGIGEMLPAPHQGRVDDLKSEMISDLPLFPSP